MNVADMLGALRRRWYVLVAGLIVAGLAAYGVWTIVKVEYTRTATQLMLPGPGTIPDDANPFLFVGGLSQAADVLVRKMGSPDVLAPVEREFDGMQIVVTRDPLSSGPVLLTSVTSQSDDEAAAAVDELVQLSESTLEDIQRIENIPTSDRITLVTLTTDDKGAVEQKARLIAAGATAAGTGALTLLLVALIDGLARARAQRRGRPGGSRRVRRAAADDLNIRPSAGGSDELTTPGEADGDLINPDDELVAEEPVREEGLHEGAVRDDAAASEEAGKPGHDERKKRRRDRRHGPTREADVVGAGRS